MLFTCTGFPLVPQTYRLIPILRSLQELSSLSGKPFTQPFSARLDPFTITIGPKVPSPDRTSAVLYLLSLDTLFYFFFYHYLKLSCLPVSQACPTESIISSKEALFHYYIPVPRTVPDMISICQMTEYIYLLKTLFTSIIFFNFHYKFVDEVWPGIFRQRQVILQGDRNFLSDGSFLTERKHRTCGTCIKLICFHLLGMIISTWKKSKQNPFKYLHKLCFNFQRVSIIFNKTEKVIHSPINNSNNAKVYNLKANNHIFLPLTILLM